jgi:signal transduction histidine kinase
VEGVADDIRRTLHDTRWAIHDLRDGRLPEVGFGTALADHVRRAADMCGIIAHLSITEGAVSLPVAVQTELLRIAQESVTNVRKHAHATNIWVTVELSGRNALLVVADDGVAAFPAAADRPQDCYGLRIMRERAERIGADLTHRPRAGGGTVVEVVLRDEPLGSPGAALARLLRKTQDRKMHTRYEGMPSWA